MESEDVVHVLRRFREALVPRGLMLDLQVVRPHPVVETDGAVVCEIDGSPLFRTADGAAAQVDAMIESGSLSEEAADDHDVLKHYSSGAELVDDFADSPRNLPPEWIPWLAATEGECTVRERCRTRRLRSRPESTRPRRRAVRTARRARLGRARRPASMTNQCG